MAPRFYGRYEHSLDVKGRVILPARYRGLLGNQVFVSQYLDKCLALWTPEEFERQMDEQETKQNLGPIERAVARLLCSGAVEVEIDRQGRVAIPAYLRDYAGLHTEGPILLAGTLNRIELWNLEEWAHRVAPAEAQLVNDRQELSDLIAAAPAP